MNWKSILILLVSLWAAGALAAADGAWLARVPVTEHGKANPYDGKPDAVAAGRNIYEEHCGRCHGENAEGTKKRPSLKSERVQQLATVGDLHWLLVNGNLKSLHG
jgi:mono/diheme cytochrome c family protein